MDQRYWLPHPFRVPLPLIIGAVTFLAYALTLPEYQLRVTDLSARRVSLGEVPYRDFWTMYAPGSFLTLGAVFAAVGQELIVSRLLGMLTSAAAVAGFFRLGLIVLRDTHPRSWGVPVPAVALLPTLIFAATFFGTGYYSNFSSYAPVILLIWLAIGRLARFAADPARTRDLVVAGAYLGVGLIFKHDIAGYALAIAATVSLVVPGSQFRKARTGTAAGTRDRMWPALVLSAVALAVAAVPFTMLIVLGAGADMLRDLVIFPLTDFRHVRGEYFPIVPHLRADLISNAKEVIRWTMCNVPTIALLAGLPPLWRGRRQLAADQRFVLGFLLAAFPLYWTAAHVQINTHAVTLAGIGALVGTAGLSSPWTRVRWRSPLLAVVACGVAGWCGIVCLERGYEVVQRLRYGTEPLSLPRLSGITMPPDTARWMRALAEEIQRAGEPGAALLVLGNRNDVLVFADTTPYWLSSRPPATRYHELHPAITDTAAVQHEMLAALEQEPLPVLVREHRFNPAELEPVKRAFLQHVPVGGTLLDEWVAARYADGPRFGRYEVMRPRGAANGTRKSSSNATEVTYPED